MSARSEKEDRIAAMCGDSGCSDKIRKIHFEQYVKRNWHPHPPKDFCDWWITEYEFSQGIDAKRAYNCEIYRQRFLSEKEIGVA